MYLCVHSWGLLLALAHCRLGSGPALRGVLGLCPPPGSFTQGPLRPGHSLRPVSLARRGPAAPTDPEGLAAPGGGAGRFPAHLEVMTPFLLPGGATDVSSQARLRTGGRCAKAGSEAARGEGEPQNRGCPAHSQQAAGQSPAPLRGAGNRRIHSLIRHRPGRAVHAKEVGAAPVRGRGLDVLTWD